MDIRQAYTATEQEVFDYVMRALLKQGKPAVTADEVNTGGVRCVYRAPDGSKCAVGHLLTEKDMARIYRSRPDQNLSFRRITDTLALPYNSRRVQFIEDLQALHDSVARKEDFVAALKRQAREFCKTRELSTEVLDE